MVLILSQSDTYLENYDILEFIVYKSQKYYSDGINISWYYIILINIVAK